MPQNRAREVDASDIAYAFGLWRCFEKRLYEADIAELAAEESDDAIEQLERSADQLAELMDQTGLSLDGERAFAEVVAELTHDNPALAAVEGETQDPTLYAAGIQRGALMGLFVGLTVRRLTDFEIGRLGTAAGTSADDSTGT